MLFAKPSFRLALIGWRTFYLAPDLADYRARMHRAQSLAARPYREVREGWRQWSYDREEKPHGTLTGLFLHGFGDWVRNDQRGLARARLTDLALAAAAFRAQHGRYPARAGDLVPAFIPAMPQDPFDGQPLRMRAVGDDLLLYSVADDARDDGGAEFVAKQRTGDLTLCLGAKLWRERRVKPSSSPGGEGKRTEGGK
jgi:hypothetical protein